MLLFTGTPIAPKDAVGLTERLVFFHKSAHHGVRRNSRTKGISHRSPSIGKIAPQRNPEFGASLKLFAPLPRWL
jgi:hypothetical protein